MKIFTAIAFYLAASTAWCSGLPGKTADLSWMAGHWKGQFQGSPMEAFYTDPEGGMILGTTKIVSGAQVSFFEFERIEQAGDSLVLKPMPFGNAGVEFSLTELSGTRAVFDNPSHDFPQKIIYELRPNGQLLGRIEGKQNGQETSSDFLFTKVQ